MVVVMRSSHRFVLSLLPLVLPIAVASTTGCATDGDETGGTDATESAVLDRSVARGADTKKFPIAGRADEICVIPQHLAGADYDKDDAADEAELCSYNFHSASPGVDVDISPKTVSTNPGTDVKSSTGKKLAKYKQSITCSYTPSILGYYHLSRALGGIGDVKPAVVRTMDLAEHKKLSAAGVRATAGQGLINTLWKQYASWESNPSNPKYKDLLFTDGLDQIYGALQVNPRGEVKYREINSRSPGTDISVAFRSTSAYKAATSGQDVRALGRDLKDFAQPIQQMKDVSDMVLIDTLLSQQDRYGNIHAVDYYYTVESGKISKVKKSKWEKENPGKEPPPNLVLVRKMLLKDNDCGVVKTNVAARAGMLGQLRHMSPKTYKALRWFNGQFGRGSEAAKFFSREALFTQKDIDMLRANLAAAESTLHAACTSGKLKLDLRMEDQLTGKAPDPADCEKAEAPGE